MTGDQEHMEAAEKVAVAEHWIVVQCEAMHAKGMGSQVTWNRARDTGSLGS